MRIVQSMESARAFAKRPTADLWIPSKNCCGNGLVHGLQRRICPVPVFVKAGKYMLAPAFSNQSNYGIIAWRVIRLSFTENGGKLTPPARIIPNVFQRRIYVAYPKDKHMSDAERHFLSLLKGSYRRKQAELAQWQK